MDNTNKNEYPNNRVAWTMVALLTVAYVFSYIDRSILGLLVQRIKADLGFTDFEIGLLMGPAFALIYAIGGLFLGWLADHKTRTRIVFAGVAIWSVATAATGLLKNFWPIFGARMAVGVGEAALNPTAMSMISDSFPPERRGKPVAFYTMALSVGGGIAFLLSAGLLHWVDNSPEFELPLFGSLAPWRMVFIIFGLAGVLLSVVFLFMREPKRQVKPEDADQKSHIWDMLKYVFERMLAYGGPLALFSALLVMAYSQGWLAATFERTWGWSDTRYGSVNGVILILFGPTSVMFGGWLSDRMYKKGRADAPYLILYVGVVIATITGATATLMPSGELGFAVMAINTIGIALASSVAPTTILNITPSKISAQACALLYMTGSLTGANFGPVIVGYLSESVFGPEHLNYAFSSVSVIFGIPAILFGWYAKNAYVAQIDSEAARMASQEAS